MKIYGYIVGSKSLRPLAKCFYFISIFIMLCYIILYHHFFFFHDTVTSGFSIVTFEISIFSSKAALNLYVLFILCSNDHQSLLI